MIQFINVSKAYKQHNVLENINLSINEGELVVLIGPSGCGKTTLLKMINRLIDPTSGQILINGTDIIAQDPIELRRNMGYVIQQTGLFVHMTVRENIEIVPHLAKLPQDEIVERTVKLMEMVGLPQEFLDRYPNHLSGGQQQRIGVARAFAMDPRNNFDGRAVFGIRSYHTQPAAGRACQSAGEAAQDYCLCYP